MSLVWFMVQFPSPLLVNLMTSSIFFFDDEVMNIKFQLTSLHGETCITLIHFNSSLFTCLPPAIRIMIILIWIWGVQNTHSQAWASTENFRRRLAEKKLPEPTSSWGLYFAVFPENWNLIVVSSRVRTRAKAKYVIHGIEMNYNWSHEGNQTCKCEYKKC